MDKITVQTYLVNDQIMLACNAEGVIQALKPGANPYHRYTQYPYGGFWLTSLVLHMGTIKPRYHETTLEELKALISIPFKILDITSGVSARTLHGIPLEGEAGKSFRGGGKEFALY